MDFEVEEEEEEEEVVRVNAVELLTVPSGLQYAVSGDIARLLINLMVTQMLGNVPLTLTARSGLQRVLSGDIVKRLEEEQTLEVEVVVNQTQDQE